VIANHAPRQVIRRPTRWGERRDLVRANLRSA